MEVVIRLPKEVYETIQQTDRTILGRRSGKTIEFALWNGVKNGIVLPEKHGRIIDESRINKCEQAGLIMKNGDIVRCLVTDAPTIIEKARDKDADSN